jgi:hypothetical protein
VRRDFNGNRTLLAFPVTVAANAAPGPRNLYLEGLAERATLSGVIEVVKP